MKRMSALLAAVLLAQPLVAQVGTFSPRVAELLVPRPEQTSQTFIRQKLAELDSFKSSESFRLYGFGRGGPHYRWLKAIQDRQLDHGEVALGDLLEMGTEYLRTGGRESHYTVFARKEILKAIGEEKQEQSSPEISPKPDQPGRPDIQEVIQRIPGALQEAYALSKTDPAGAAKMLEEYHSQLLAGQARDNSRVYYLGVLESRIAEYKARAGE